MRLIGFVVLALASSLAWAQESPGAPANAEQPAGVGAIAPYLGLRIEQVEFPGVEPDEAARLLAATLLKTGEALTREILHDGIQSLFATGRFADIQVEAEHVPPGVKLRFLTVPNYFVGQVAADGVSSNPTPTQLVSASRLQLGELYTREKLDRSLAGIQRALEDNGFHNAKVTSSEERNEPQRQVDITFHVIPGARALVGQITLQGDAGYSKSEIEEVGKFHPGDPIISTRLTRALQRIRAKYQKQDRLLAQVSVAKREYRSERNAVDYALQVDRGPIVEVAAEGYKFSQAELRKLVPIYEEGAVDDDLLNEGRRSLQNRLQTLGYFDATVGVSQHTVQDGKGLRVIYVINPGERHKLTAIRISGNQLFTAEQIRAVMQEQPAGRLFSHGRYSEALLEQDALNIKGLYRASGYQQAGVTSKILNDYQGDSSQVAIDLTIKEGPQTRVAWVRLEGNYLLPSDQLLKYPSTEEGQGFAESNLSEDRDKILGVYFDNGFSNATADVTYVPVVPSPDAFPRVGVTFTIKEGEQFFVNRVFLSGLHYTRPGVARREFRVPASWMVGLVSSRYF